MEQKKPCLIVEDTVFAVREHATVKCSSGEGVARIDDASWLRFKAEYLPDGANGGPGLRTSIRNESPSGVWVNIRMRIDSDWERDKELRLEETNGGGDSGNELSQEAQSLKCWRLRAASSSRRDFDGAIAELLSEPGRDNDVSNSSLQGFERVPDHIGWVLVRGRVGFWSDHYWPMPRARCGRMRGCDARKLPSSTKSLSMTVL